MVGRVFWIEAAIFESLPDRRPQFSIDISKRKVLARLWRRFRDPLAKLSKIFPECCTHNWPVRLVLAHDTLALSILTTFEGTGSTIHPNRAAHLLRASRFSSRK